MAQNSFFKFSSHFTSKQLFLNILVKLYTKYSYIVFWTNKDNSKTQDMFNAAKLICYEST